MKAESNYIYESELTKSQVEAIHKFGRDWVTDYDPKLRSKWERAFKLWAYDYVAVMDGGRNNVPVGK